MRLLAIAVFVTLPGCTWLKPEPEVVTKYIEVQVPGPLVPCKIPFIEPPPDMVSNLEYSDSIYHKVKVLMAERELVKAYTLKMETAVSSCNENN